jgi:phosphatidylserine/phosphatidylglycerophosphate/cardiolipin synthase-like enzyme
VVVIDRTHVVTGSFNLSQSAQKNAENLLLTEDPGTAGEYVDYFHDRARTARPLRRTDPLVDGIMSPDPAVAMTVR